MPTTYADLAERLPEADREHVRELAENVLFMRAKLEETRHGIARQQVVIPYDNGGGQTGIRANPAFKEYENLLKAYTHALVELRGLLDSASHDEEADSPLKRILAEAEQVLVDAG